MEAITMPDFPPKEVPQVSIDRIRDAIWAALARTLTDPDSYKADVSALALEASLAAKLATAHFNSMQLSKEFSAETGIETLTLDNGTPTAYTTYRDMTVSLPSGAVLVKASLVALIHAMNLGVNAFGINMSLNFRKGAAAPSVLFSATPGFSVPASEYSITPWSGIFDVSAIVDDLAATYSARFTLTGVGTTNDLRCLTGYVLVLYYKMG